MVSNKRTTPLWNEGLFLIMTGFFDNNAHVALLQGDNFKQTCFQYSLLHGECFDTTNIIFKFASFGF